MTQQDKIKKLATEAMGFSFVRDLSTIELDDWLVESFCNVRSSGEVALKEKDKGNRIFNPFANSADNDALIEAFVGNGGKFMIDATTDTVVVLFDGAHIVMEWDGFYTTAKKNEAVCEAILKAVTEGGE